MKHLSPLLTTFKNCIYAVQIICLFVVLLSPSFAYAGLLDGPPTPKVLAELTDANGNLYEFRETYELNHGLHYYTYDFGSKVNGYKIIYEGRNYTDGYGCPSAASAKRFSNPKEALVKNIFARRDFNDDHIDDIDLSLAIKDCKTSEITFFEILILSKQDGFYFKQYNIEVNHEK